MQFPAVFIWYAKGLACIYAECVRNL